MSTPSTPLSAKVPSKTTTEALFGIKPNQPLKKTESKSLIGEKKFEGEKRPEMKKRDSDTSSVELAAKAVKNADVKANSKFALFGQDPNSKVVKKRSSISVSPEKNVKEDKGKEDREKVKF